jgi:hypothetical protein
MSRFWWTAYLKFINKYHESLGMNLQTGFKYAQQYVH